MPVFYCDPHEVPLPPRHPFPMAKYRLLRHALLAEGLIEPAELRRAPAASEAELVRVHDPGYVRSVLSGTLAADAIRRLGFPWSPGLVRRTLASVGGTLAAARAALASGWAGNLAGGTHHAHRDFGSGYCVFHDHAVAAGALLAERAVTRVLIVDLDVHHGDGSAALFADEPRVFTLSVHGERNFPRLKPASDLDVALPDATGDAAYLAALEPALRSSFAASRPELVLYQAGVDPLASDRLGRLALSHAGLEERDRLVFEACRAARAPVVLTLGGGYAEPITDSVEAHCGTYRALRAAIG